MIVLIQIHTVCSCLLDVRCFLFQDDVSKQQLDSADHQQLRELLGKKQQQLKAAAEGQNPGQAAAVEGQPATADAQASAALSAAATAAGAAVAVTSQMAGVQQPAPHTPTSPHPGMVRPPHLMTPPVRGWGMEEHYSPQPGTPTSMHRAPFAGYAPDGTPQAYPQNMMHFQRGRHPPPGWMRAVR